jgi:hypothetical protein
MKGNKKRKGNLDDPKSSGAGGDTPQGSGLNIDGLGPTLRPKKFQEASRSRCNSTCHFLILSL